MRFVERGIFIYEAGPRWRAVSALAAAAVPTANAVPSAAVVGKEHVFAAVATRKRTRADKVRENQT